MDILDIDEALKDDSFICLEDKTHDDVSNILQQWKSNNCSLPTQYQQEQAYKLNSRTFTRPRRKSAQNLDPHFAHTSGHNGVQTTPPVLPEPLLQKFAIASPQPMLQLEIGGLVTTMHKSFLQDTSPPSSICSSMEMSIERMNNSLITSADFTNINFLQSTQSLDFNDTIGNGGEIFNLANKTTSDGYTLSDMIRDRKALESLTMSGDGTLIKDSHIGQIDDISLALSKTASGYSTMDNSTESMQEDHHNLQRNGICRQTCAATAGKGVNDLPENKCTIMHRTMLLGDEVIGDTTFDLVDNSIYEGNDNVGNIVAVAPLEVKRGNETFKRPWLMDETVCLPTKANLTFEFKQLTPDAGLGSETRCETPENAAERSAVRKFYESTPQATSVRAGAQHNTPTLKLAADEVNLSPIVGAKEQLNATRVLDEMFGEDSGARNVNSKTFSNTFPRLESIEQMLEHMEAQSEADIQMQSVLELAHAEEELLASSNDQEFENMLEEFSKVEVNAEHMKIKKSLDTIKRRLNRDTVPLSNTTHITHDGEAESYESGTQQRSADTHLADLSEPKRNNRYLKMDGNSSAESRRSLLSDCSTANTFSSPSPPSTTISTSSAASSITASASGGANSTGERLLSRRSRLYDNINLSTLAAGGTISPSRSRSLGASYTVHKRADNATDQRGVEVQADGDLEKYETEYEEDKPTQSNNGKTAEANEAANPLSNTTNYSGIGTYKLSERRERDRDRFKTIKILKGHSAIDGLVAVNVPCIDDDISVVDHGVVAESSAPSHNGNKVETECESECATMMTIGGQNGSTKPQTVSKLNQNFLTYKKPKDKPTTVANLPKIAPVSALPAVSASSEELEKRPEPPSRLRSRSRPRYISGLQKMTVVKATSAGDLERATVPSLRPPNGSASHAAIDNCQDTPGVVGNALNITQPKYSRSTQPLKASNAEIKSPMGAKSKSFHNLSSNFGFNGASGSGLPVPRTSNFGMRKHTANDSGAVAAGISKERPANGAQSTPAQQHTDDSVFKVPKLVSGLRGPGVKRAGLVRPSSGYYSLNSLAAKGMPPLPQQQLAANDVDSDGGRHSPADSMSSASSRGSIQSTGGGIAKPVAIAIAPKSAHPVNTNALNLTKITISSTGIPKPSGLRPPATAIKRSGLPKPATTTARR